MIVENHKLKITHPPATCRIRSDHQIYRFLQLIILTSITSLVSILDPGSAIAIKGSAVLDANSPIHSDRSYLLRLTWDGACTEQWSPSPVEVTLTNRDDAIIIRSTHVPPVEQVECRGAGWELSYTIPIWLPPFRDNTLVKLKLERDGTTYIGTKTYSILASIKAPILKTEADASLISGWYNLERNPANNEVWRWMAQESKLTLPNHAQEYTLHLEGWIPQEKLPEPSGLHVIVNGNEIDYFTPEHGYFTVRYVLPVLLLGFDRLITLELKTDRVYHPSEDGITDRRELGMMLKQLHYSQNRP